jgi:hypothetical protein
MAGKRSGRWLLNGAAREHARAAGNPEWERVEWALVDRGDVPDWYAYETEGSRAVRERTSRPRPQP